MSAITLAAPAKLNLHLEIIGRREDGFHELETLFQTIDLHDLVTVTTATGSGITLTCDDPSLPTDRRNLAWRAAESFIAAAPTPLAVTIHLNKRIPHGAGLGGGSSDAAAVLRALARLCPDHHAPEQLQRMASELGSDVPFFLVGGTALGRGRGELITHVPDLPSRPVTVFMPTGTVSTPAAYQTLSEDERGPRAPRSITWWHTALTNDGVDTLLFNRLTGPAMRLCPEVGDLLDWLKTTTFPSLMSGSGAACFALAHVDGQPPVGVRAWRTRFRSRADLDRTDAQ